MQKNAFPMSHWISPSTNSNEDQLEVGSFIKVKEKFLGVATSRLWIHCIVDIIPNIAKVNIFGWNNLRLMWALGLLTGFMLFWTFGESRGMHALCDNKQNHSVTIIFVVVAYIFMKGCTRLSPTLELSCPLIISTNNLWI